MGEFFSLFCILVFLGAAHNPAHAQNEEPRRITFAKHATSVDQIQDARLYYRFPTGIRVFSRGGQIYVQNSRDAEPIELLTGKIISFPVIKTSELDPVLYEPKEGAPAVVISTTHGLAVVTSAGRVIRLPVDASKYGRGDIDGLVVFQFGRDERGRTLGVISVAYAVDTKAETPEVEGETFIVRMEDGLAFRADYDTHLFSKEPHRSVSVKDGILTIPGCDRQFDTRALESEARFPARRPGLVLNPKGEPIKNVKGAFQARFPEVTKAELEQAFDISSEGEKAIESMRIAMARPESGSAVLLGESGVGKTQLIRAFFARARNGEYPEIPRTIRFVEVSAASFNQGANYVGTTESMVQLLVEGAKLSPTFLFIDEMHEMRGVGTHSGSSTDVLQMVKKSLSDGSLRLVGASTPAEFNSAFAGDTAFLRRVIRVTLNEPSLSELPGYIKSWCAKYNRPAPSDEVIQLIVRTASRFNAVGAQPDKTTEFLGYVYAQLELAGQFNSAPTRKDVEQAALKRYQTPEEAFDFKALRERLERAPEVLDQYVVGNSQGKLALIRAARNAFAGTQDPLRPAVRVLFVGPRGVGKSELGIALNKAFNVPSTRIEMGNYAEGGVEAFQRELLQAVRKGAYCVIILDEIEKAHPIVQNALLAALDSGIINARENINSRGETSMVKVSLRNVMIIGTSNAGKDLILREHGSSGRIGYGAQEQEQERNTAIDPAHLRQAVIRDGISEPLLDRFEHLVPVLPATRAEFEKILELHLARTLREVGAQLEAVIKVSNEREFIDYAMRHFYTEGMSNRIVHKIVQAFVRSEAAEARLSGPIIRGRMTLTFREEAFRRAFELLKNDGNSGCSSNLKAG